jgi:hypothetical protein
MVERRGAYRILVGRPELKRPLGRPKHTWKNNFKMDFQNWDVEALSGLIWFRIRIGNERV